MPLRLLPKKSWNVYGAANRARVAQDEASAAAVDRDRERERQLRESDATVEALRQEIIAGDEQLRDDATTNHSHTSLRKRSASEADPNDTVADHQLRITGNERGNSHKRRRLAGEDDTDRELRLAKEHVAGQLDVAFKLRDSTNTNAPLVDGNGNINLFPEPRVRTTTVPTEVAKAKAQMQQQKQDSWTQLQAPQKAWYLLNDSSQSQKDAEPPASYRRARAIAESTASNDPMTSMKRAQNQLKAVQKKRQQSDPEPERHRRSRKHASKRLRKDEERRHHSTVL